MKTMGVTRETKKVEVMLLSFNNYGLHEELSTYAYIFKKQYSNPWQMCR